MVSGNTYPPPTLKVRLVLTLVLAGSLVSALGVRVMHGPLRVPSMMVMCLVAPGVITVLAACLLQRNASLYAAAEKANRALAETNQPLENTVVWANAGGGIVCRD